MRLVAVAHVCDNAHLASCLDDVYKKLTKRQFMLRKAASAMSPSDNERIPADLRHRVPPGQTLTKKWPVLHYSGVPVFMDMGTWQFRVVGDVEQPLSLTWDEFRRLPAVRRTSDFHCVTTWSRLDNRWEGVLFSTLASLAKPRSQARFAMLHSFDGYYTNVPLSWLLQDDVLFAWNHDDQPLTEEHGGPLRLVVPKLYAWKSAKWVSGIEFMTTNKRGFWEERGYHNRGEPFAEERYAYQETDETSQ